MKCLSDDRVQHVGSSMKCLSDETGRFFYVVSTPKEENIPHIFNLSRTQSGRLCLQLNHK